MLFNKRRDKAPKSGKDSRNLTPTPATSPAPDIQADAMAAPDVQPASIPMRPPIAGDSLVVGDLSQLNSSTGRAAQASMEDGWLAVVPKRNVQTMEALQAKEGDAFLVRATVKLLKAGANGKQSPFALGPVFVDEKGNVIRGMRFFDMPSETPAQVVSKARAPAGTVGVRLGLRGAWEKDQEPADYILGLADLRIEKVAT